MRNSLAAALALFPILLFTPACAQETSDPEAPVITTGPVFTDFGPAATVDTTAPLPGGVEFRIAFDTAKGAEEGRINKTLESAARFINMHARIGVPVENMNLAVVVHSKAVFDVSKKSGEADHANVSVVKALTEKGVRVIVCGQSAAYYGVSKSDLLPGVEMQVSAMTAHALLQQDGYTMNPF